MQKTDAELYDIFARRDMSFAVPLFMGVISTGIFCRPGCPARLPKPENCIFYPDASSALKAGFRACKRCHPTRLPGEATPLVKTLIGMVEEEPERRWSEKDLKAAGIDPSTARRQFQARFGMTFSDYARQRRLALVSHNLSKGDPVIEAQLNAGYASPSGFRDAFSKSLGVSPVKMDTPPLLIEWIDTPLGAMVAVCDEDALYLLEFTNRKYMHRQMQKLSKHQKRQIMPGRTPITDQIEGELGAYFNGTLARFTTSVITTGTAFQKHVWGLLQTIPTGHVWSYSDLARAAKNDKAVRAVAGANANNGLAIIIPCHRVISKGGGLGGYAGGVERKQWLLDHERKHALP